MKKSRYGHTSCSGLICGGGGPTSTMRTCEKLNGTQISPLPFLTLIENRYDGLCWTLPGDNKILLLGPGTTTEIVSGPQPSGYYSFDLRDKTR